jgi:GGDEF domain-containing protein
MGWWPARLWKRREAAEQTKAAFDAALAREMSRAQRGHHSLALLMLEVRSEPGGALESRRRLARDAVSHVPSARLMDQSFDLGDGILAMLCPYATAYGAENTIAGRMRVGIGRAANGPVGLSVGIAAYPADASAAGDLEARARAAFDIACQRGGGGVAWHEVKPDLTRPEEAWLSLALGDLRTFESIRAYLEDGSRIGEMAERQRVGDRLAGALALSDVERHALQAALLLYDLGRIGVLDAIWQKSGPLSPGERRTMEAHPLIGASLLRDHAAAAPLLPIVLYHHERFDGSGYPEGLRGSAIPLLARAVAVVDAYLAMMSDRPYRPRLSRSEALTELWHGAGSQWDPRMVEALAGSLS